jgi:predicted transposase/invertase (TIGR01784 family)
MKGGKKIEPLKTEAKKESKIKVFMNLLTDFGFKKVFGVKKLLIAFLNALDALPEKVVDIEYLPLEQLGIVKQNHKAVYDIYVKTPSGRRYIVEMQISKHANFVERLLLYASYSIVYQSTSGKSIVTDVKSGKVKETDYDIAGVYVIAILDFVLFNEKETKNIIVEPIHSVRKYANKGFTDKFQFLTIELPKFKKTLSELDTVVDKFLYSLIHMGELTERPKEMNEDILKYLYETAQINKLSEKEMETYQQSVLDYYDVRQAVDYAEKEGRRKGKREGKKEGIEIGEKRGRTEGIEIGEKRGRIEGIEIGEKRGRTEGIEIGEKRSIERFVKNCYAANMNVETIVAITGFTEEQVYNILANG